MKTIISKCFTNFPYIENKKEIWNEDKIQFNRRGLFRVQYVSR